MPAFRFCLMALLVVGVTACTGAPPARPATPNVAALEPAEQALARARQAHAERFAPQPLDAARRRIATARDIIYYAAKASRPLSDVERTRVEQLVAAAELDAQTALVQTQAKAVMAKLAQLQGESNTTGSPAAAGSTGAIQ